MKLLPQAWLEPALRYFEERGSLQKFDLVIQELNALDELKARDTPEIHPRYDLVIQELNALDELKARDTPEIHSRCARDMPDPRYAQDVPEIHPRCARDRSR